MVSSFRCATLSATISRVFALVLAFLCSNLVSAAEGDIARLITFAESLSAFEANFEQTIYDADSNPLQSSTGDVILKRPGRFIWNYAEPSPQSIVADGERVWMYDKELEQVTVSPITERASGTPLALLMGDSPVTDEFDVKSLGLSDGIDWFELTPKTKETDFELVFLGLNELADNATGLAIMELRDSFGQATQIRFTDYNPNIVPADNVFDFEAPVGVDVIGQP